MRALTNLLVLIWLGTGSATFAFDSGQLAQPSGAYPNYQSGAATSYQNPALFQNPTAGTYGTVVPQTLPPAGAAPQYGTAGGGWDPYGGQQNACPPQPVPVVPVIPVPPTNHCHLFGEFLYLRLNDAAMVSYALPVDGVFPPPPSPAPVGPVGTLDPEFDIGFRVGGGYAWTAATEITGMYTWYESDTTSSLTAVPPAVLLSLVAHPATASAGTAYTSASATNDLTLQMGDVDYRRTVGDEWLRTSYVIGGRFVDLEQSFAALFTGGVAPGPAMQNVATDIDFLGGGIRLGMASDLTSQYTGLFGYANGFASFVAGEFSSSFVQTDATAMPTVVATTARDDSRIVPILDIELGVGWETDDQSWRFSVGYLFSAWFNVITTEEFIRAVHSAQYAGLSDTLTFDGLVARADWRF